MRYRVIFTSLWLLAAACGSQPVQKGEVFEGVICYRVTVLADPGQTGVARKMGNRTVSYYRQGEYHDVYSGEELQHIWYKRNNVEYTQLKGIDTLLYASCAEEKRPFERMEKKENDTTILGYTCNRLSLEYAGRKVTYWYAPELYIPGELFKDREFAFMNRYFAEANAAILMRSHEGPLFSTLSVAVSVERKRLDDSVFVLPELPEKKWFE